MGAYDGGGALIRTTDSMPLWRLVRRSCMGKSGTRASDVLLVAIASIEGCIGCGLKDI